MFTELSDVSWVVAATLAAEKEEAVARALDHHFNGTDWDESVIGELCRVEVDLDGSERVYMGDRHMLTFGPIRSTTTVENGRVLCKFWQKVEVHYG